MLVIDPDARADSKELINSLTNLLLDSNRLTNDKIILVNYIVF